ncbi:MAG: HAD family phosphatase [Deltaproteobacteria bacterium]|nr:HAD family phosphatase [Deltaproteobacteria bacterium]
MPVLDPVQPWSDVRLVAFDVDGTLVENDHGLVVWQVLNDLYVGDAALAEERFRQFLAGELTYAEWVRLDVEGWRSGGATRMGIESAIREHLRLVPSAREVTSELRSRGYTLAVISGTLDVVLDVLFPNHPFHHVYTNRIAFDDAGAISSWEATPYDMDGKADAVKVLAGNLQIDPRHIVFVGDNLNDCSAMELVGRAVGYDPKHEKVRSLAQCVLPSGGLRGLLDFLPGCSHPETGCSSCE